MRRTWVFKLIAVLIPLMVVGEVINYTHVTTVKGQVVDKYTKWDKEQEKDDFFIVVKKGNGVEQVVQNSDSVLMFKFDSADVQAAVHKGKDYEFKLRGYRIPVLSLFPNVAAVKGL
ncbi:DUF1523 family protein [Bacillus paranthracis]|uniref:DUF1523 family protein n=1 Tax=Bacillus paranthracis TaxID=2026186 RepID=UPI00187A8A8D|nr:DUF1523 family protein [Bacillus paranthracis]MBE7114496.1 DUF1523 family protein [Bacillus paranthracis]MBE7154630.1 DUF1523 family protein [Bacillus paranthracis]